LRFFEKILSFKHFCLLAVEGSSDDMKSSEPVERVYSDQTLIAIIIRSEYEEKGVSFFSPFEFSQQLGILVHPSGFEVKPHMHKMISRDVRVTQEVLHLIRGKVEIVLYDEHRKPVQTCILNPGDTILLAFGGHGLKVLEPAKIVEIKQGPYAGTDDKEYFLR
jgi:cupin fold WbuC family metalloprotein